MIGLLNAYHFELDPNTYQKDYAPMCMEYLQRVMPDIEIKEYLVAQNIFPKDIKECDGYIISGSPASCYDDTDWINNLKIFIQDCHHAKIKLLGICFGHQIIATALGGDVTKSDKGWGVGVMPIQIIDQKRWMTPACEHNICTMLYSHQDQVSKIPTGAQVLAKSDFCPIAAYSIENHIFSMQGHPEFTKQYAKKRYDSRQEKLGSKTYDQAIHSLDDTTNEILIGKWISNFFKNK